ncbi:MAG: hypothetical protein HY423_07990 [Candidatus Lambdaproteobacteria bacterium]|nr:hypothetical protein [Candidatus Lambdaproteobacteria bacterium]
MSRSELLAGLGLVLLAGVIAFAVGTAPRQPRPGPAPGQAGAPPADIWLRGLMVLNGLHYAEYGPKGLIWELWSNLGRVEARRYLFGVMPSQPLLLLHGTRAAIRTGTAVVELDARRTYFDPRKGEWIFTDGELRQAGDRRRFRQLHWYPAERRLERPTFGRLPPILRFWEPVY